MVSSTVVALLLLLHCQPMYLLGLLLPRWECGEGCSICRKNCLLSLQAAACYMLLLLLLLLLLCNINHLLWQRFSLLLLHIAGTAAACRGDSRGV
jgi:hypothetical protein